MADEGEDRQHKRRRVTVVHDAVESAADQPILAPLPLGWISNNPSLSFAGFQRRGNGKHRTLVNDDTTVTFEVSNTAGSNPGPSQQVVHYAVGVYDPNEKTLRITDAPVFNVASRVKSLASLQVPDRQLEIKDSSDYLKARTQLGESFGTKKLKQQLRAQERNKVDLESLQHLSAIIESGIREKAASMPSQGDIEESVNRARPIPPYNASATTPADVYAIDTLAPPEELAQVPYKPLLKMRREDVEELRATRSYSEYVLGRMTALAAHSKKDRKELQLLLYLTYLLRFRNIKDGALNEQERLQARMGDAPQEIVECFVERFTEVLQSLTDDTVKTRHMTPRSRDLVTEYALAVVLHLEQFSFDPAVLMADLKLSRRALVEYLKALGCQTDSVVAPDSTPENPKTTKVMRLKVPLQFPKPRRGPKK